MSFIRSRLYPAVALLVLLTVLTGVVYPVVVWAVGQVAFHDQANGSLIVVDGKTVGSSLIGQAFSDPKYFWSRPSAAGKDGYDADGSAGSNLGPTSKDLIDRISADVDKLRAANGGGPVPVDLVTTSASGLDPDISPAAAEFQVARVAKARGMSEDAVRAAVARHTDRPLFGFIGMPVDIGMMMTGSISLGISVDCTFHFLVYYREGYSAGLTSAEACRRALQHSGEPMLESTVICSVGMLALCLSSFVPTARFGGMMAAQMMASVLGELVILPALLCCRPERRAAPQTTRIAHAAHQPGPAAPHALPAPEVHEHAA